MDDEKIKERLIDLVERTGSVSKANPKRAPETKSDADVSQTPGSKNEALADFLTEADRDSLSSAPEAESKALESDESFHSGKISFAQKVLGNRFEVLDVLGQGGMGAVYKVRDLATDRVVALKLLKPELCQDKTVLKRFQSEAAALAELDHQNIVSVYDHGITDDGAPYLTMQFVGSTTLTEYIKSKGTVSPEQAVEIALQICEALDYAHHRKIVHRDIKPSNVIIAEQVSTLSDSPQSVDASHLSVQLVDFGIAKIVESSSGHTTNLTQTGDVFGTPAYMSPEQCEGQEVDHRSDIYSLGCLLYEMLSGRQPFQGANAIQVAVKHISGKPDRFAEKYSEGHLMNSLEQIVLKCMRKPKSERYQSVAELKDDLKMSMAGGEVAYDAEAEIEEAKKKRTKLHLMVGAAYTAGASIFQFLLYVVIVGNLFSKYWASPNIGDGERLMFLMFAFVGLLTHIQSVLKIKYKKRHSFSSWGDQLFHVAMVTTSVAFLAASIPPIQTTYADATAALLTICFLYTWAFGGVYIVSSLFMRGVNLINRLQHLMQKKTYVKPKPALIGSSQALVRYFLSSTALILLTTFLCPPVGSAMVGGLGIMYARLGSSFAIPTLEFALALNPRNEGASEIEAKVYTARGDHTKAVAVLTSAMERSLYPNMLRPARAKAYHALKLDVEAVQDINKALADDPNNSELLSQRGNLFAAQGSFAAARRDFTSAISYLDRSTGSDSSNYYSERALTYYAQQNYREAIADFTKALEQNSYYGRERDFVRRALCYRAMGDTVSANNDFREAALQNSVGDGEPFLIKAYAAKNVGDLDGYQRFLVQAESKGFKQEDLTKLVFDDWPGLPPLNW